jgi:hypothetical protein
MHPGADSTLLRAELAAMHLFRHRGIPADVFVPVEDVVRHGADCGVRATDLPAAIDRLVTRGLLVRRQDVAGQVACTVAGANAFDEQPGWLESHLLTPREARRRLALHDGLPASAGSRRRRGGDAPGRRHPR